MSDDTAPEDDVETRGFRVHGRVQGVGFRWSTTRRAEELELAGTVRNCPDGTVEVHARGGEESLRRLESWLHQGPRSARVERVEEIPPEEELPSGFQIVR